MPIFTWLIDGVRIFTRGIWELFYLLDTFLLIQEAKAGIYKEIYDQFHPTKSYSRLPGTIPKLKQVILNIF